MSEAESPSEGPPRTSGGEVYWPKPVAISADDTGAPRAIAGVAVEAIREEWLVEDRWWTPKALQRRYFEVVLADGRNIVVFREPAEPPERGRWFEQRA
jgi:hypothetical protein